MRYRFTTRSYHAFPAVCFPPHFPAHYFVANARFVNKEIFQDYFQESITTLSETNTGG